MPKYPDGAIFVGEVHEYRVLQHDRQVLLDDEEYWRYLSPHEARLLAVFLARAADRAEGKVE